MKKVFNIILFSFLSTPCEAPFRDNCKFSLSPVAKEGSVKDDHYARLIPQGCGAARDRNFLIVTHPVNKHARETDGNQCNYFLSFVFFFGTGHTFLITLHYKQTWKLYSQILGQTYTAFLRNQLWQQMVHRRNYT